MCDRPVQTTEEVMSAMPASRPQSTTVVPQRNEWFGHPRGLGTLFFTEMWERFSYYGMRAFLLLYMTASAEVGGLGWDTAKGGPLYGMYTALVYLMALPGGWIADKFLGLRQAVFAGGVIIMCGHICLAMHGMTLFYVGLLLVVIGTGLLKPNISAMVGSLYAQDDKRRDAGFSIYYMGINLGAFAAPLLTGFLVQSPVFRGWLTSWGMDPKNCWHWGFGAAAVGMALGLLQYVLTGHHLGDAGKRPAPAADPKARARQRRELAIGLGFMALIVVTLVVMRWPISAVVGSMKYVYIVITFGYFGFLLRQRSWTPVERKRLMAIPAFFLFASLFWSVFEQAGSTLNLFADRNTNCTIFGHGFPSSWFQSVNSVFLILLAPVFAALWMTLAKRNREPSSPNKFAFGLLFAGLGFLVMVPASKLAGTDGRVSTLWLVSVYLLHTVGELCLSPVGLSTMTKLAPARVTGQMLGVWFLASSVGNFVGGTIAGFFEKLPLPQLFGSVVAVTAGFTLLAFAIARPVRKLMGGVH
jgi:POT family proton-dependent oligopeptide transporter